MKTEFRKLCENIKMNFTLVDNPKNALDWAKFKNSYKVVLKYKKRQITIMFYQGNYNDPEVSDIINCLLSEAYASDVSFEEWIWEFGYENNKESKFIYDSCLKNSKKIHSLLGNEFDLFIKLKNLS